MVVERHIFFTTILLIIAAIAVAQQAPRSSTVLIKDKYTREAIPFAVVQNHSRGSTVLTGPNGEYKAEDALPGDTIRVYMLGYEPLLTLFSELQRLKIVYLNPSPFLLQEVKIVATDPFLYRLLYHCGKKAAGPVDTAKTYYCLQSRISDTLVEVVETFNNGVFNRHDLLSLQFKSGRLALEKRKGRHFISTETSEALLMSHTFRENSYFPATPFSFPFKKLLKEYEVKLQNKYADEQKKVIYILDFSPLKKKNFRFSGTAWIDSATGALKKIRYDALDAGQHPFLAQWKNDSIRNVDLSIVRTWDGKGNLSTIHFDYKFTYFPSADDPYTVSSSAIVMLYDHGTRFPLPFFTFPESSYADYYRVLAVPHNSFFWKELAVVTFSDAAKEEFVSNAEWSTISNTNIIRKAASDSGFFERPFVQWSEKRVRIRKWDRLEVAASSPYPADKLKIKVQLYMDINETSDSTNVVTAAILDPFETVCGIEVDNTVQLILNIYFDLFELHRRDLVKQIEGERSVKKIVAAYEAVLERAREEGQRFLKEVELGKNVAGLIRWENYVKQKTGIDNMAAFTRAE